MVRGTRGRIGIIYPADGLIDDEFFKFVPEDVAIHITRISVPEEKLSVNVVAQVAETSEIEQAAKMLRITRPNVIAYACTSGSFLKRGYEKKISQRIEKVTNIPAITTTQAVIDAFNLLGIRKVVVIAPYPDDINSHLKKYLEEIGIHIVGFKGLNLNYEWKIGNFRTEELYKHATNSFNPNADGLFIPCTGLRTAEIIEPLEKELGVPVVSANQATMWKALQIANINEPVKGCGALLRQSRIIT
ncbi:MAG: aspartate/glutamate racemase family protein [Thermoproteota archaeon]